MTHRLLSWLGITASLALAGVVLATVIALGMPEGKVTRDDFLTVRGLSRVLTNVEWLEGTGLRTAPAPLQGTELARWMAAPADGPPDRIDAHLTDYVDTEGERIRDEWGNDVLVIAVEGELYALASLGENGVWEYGGGDDIVVGHDVQMVRGRRLTRD